MNEDHDITAQLVAWRSGDRTALACLFPLVYEALRRIAHRQLQNERSDHTLDTTGLVHEAYLRLVDHSRTDWVDRSHFFAVASSAMRRVLVDYSRQYRAAKRGGTAVRIPFEDAHVDPATLDLPERAGLLLGIDQALGRLAEIDPRLVQVVECRFFGGLTEEETAEALQVTPRTVRRDWAKAKSWLTEALRE